MSAAAIVVAGGAGSRMQARVNKVFIEIAGHSILERSLELFESSSLVDAVVLVARQADLPTCESLRARFPKLSAIVAGGDVRHRSEFAGLRTLAARIDAGDIDTVLVHDAVRPFASHRLIERLVMDGKRAVGGVPGLPIDAIQVTDGWLAG